MPNEAAFLRSNLKIENMTAGEINEIENWMKHDKKWQFLRKNESLVDTIRKDADTLARMKISHENVADRLASLIMHFTSPA